MIWRHTLPPGGILWAQTRWRIYYGAHAGTMLVRDAVGDPELTRAFERDVMNGHRPTIPPGAMSRVCARGGFDAWLFHAWKRFEAVAGRARRVRLSPATGSKTGTGWEIEWHSDRSPLCEFILATRKAAEQSIPLGAKRLLLDRMTLAYRQMGVLSPNQQKIKTEQDLESLLIGAIPGDRYTLTALGAALEAKPIASWQGIAVALAVAEGRFDRVAATGGAKDGFQRFLNRYEKRPLKEIWS